MRRTTTILGTIAALGCLACVRPAQAQFGGYFGSPVMGYFGNPISYVTGGFGNMSMSPYAPVLNWWSQAPSPNTGYVPQDVLMYQATQLALAEQAAAQAAQAAAQAQRAAGEPQGTSNDQGVTVTDNGNGTVTTIAPQAAPAPMTRASTAVGIERLSNNRLMLRWAGDTAQVTSVVFSLLDRKGRAQAQKTVTTLPVQAELTRRAGTAYYQVVVHYADGETTTIAAPI